VAALVEVGDVGGVARAGVRARPHPDVRPGNGEVRSSGFKPKDSPSRPGVTGEGKTGRVSVSEPLDDASSK